MKMPNTKYTGSFIKGGPGENQSYKKYYGSMLQGFKRGGDVMPARNKKNFSFWKCRKIRQLFRAIMLCSRKKTTS